MQKERRATNNLPAIIDLSRAIEDVTGQLDKRSRRIYQHDIQAFVEWMQKRGLTLDMLTRSEMIAYRQHLADAEKYSNATAKRMWSVTCRILNEQAKNGILPLNITKDIRGFEVEDETTHTALSLEEAKELLKVVDIGTAKGQRDYAILSLMLRTGIRRFECSALDIGSLSMERGHNIATIERGKGRKRRIIKVPVDVKRHIDRYLLTTEHADAPPDAPLFVGFLRGDHPTEERISDKLIERLVKRTGKALDIDITPHGLRASFITLTLEDGAKLEQVQYAVGHKDPRTTERYQKRKLNLDDNAVDHIHL